MADDWREFNLKVIDEFRTKGGKVGGMFEGAPMVLLTTTGAKSGKPFTTPLMYRQEGSDVVIFASYGGAPKHPDWYRNLEANPEAQIELAKETIKVSARFATGDERARIWEAQKAEFPQFADYEAKTDREIPVVILERV